MKPHLLPGRQTGISLVVTLMITVLLSLLALYGAGVLVLDTRSAANDYRYREAMVAAESGIEQGLGLLHANRANVAAVGSGWTNCTSTATQCQAIRSADRTNWKHLTVTSTLIKQPDAGDINNIYLLTPISGDSSGLLFTIVAVGSSDDASGTATVKQGAFFYPLILGNVDVPLASASNLPPTGNYCIVASPNGLGEGSNVPISIWTSDSTTVTSSGSFATVQPGDFTGSCPNPASDDVMTSSSKDGGDIVQDADFPTDLFQFLFGVPAADYQTIKDEAQVVANCDSLTAASSGLIWVTGDCSSSSTIGSAAAPVLLVVEGNASFNGGANTYGLLYMFDPAGAARELKTNGNNHIHGAVIAHDSNVDLDMGGTYIIEYDKDVLTELKNSPNARALARIPGAWSDVQ